MAAKIHDTQPIPSFFLEFFSQLYATNETICDKSHKSSQFLSRVTNLRKKVSKNLFVSTKCITFAAE
jgi:hypothetical protein